MHGRSDLGTRRLPYLADGGQLGALMRAHDWSATPLGPPEGWPQPLNTLIAVMLAANQPMFVVWGPEHTLLYNDPYTEVLGNKHPRALGRPFFEVWDEIRADLDAIMERSFAGEPTYMDDITLVMQRKGYPEETHFSFFATPVRDEVGRVGGVYCACTEITGQVMAERRRREAEAALRVERDRTRRVLDGMGEGFCLLDRAFRVIDINAEGLRLEERPREEILGRTHWEAWPGSEESELGRLYKYAMAERVPISHDHRYVWPDGRAAWIEMRAYPIDDGLALFWRDVTERRSYEEALRAERDRSVEILESISDAFYAVDHDWRFTYVNRRTEELWGRSRKDLLGKVYWDEFPQAVGSEAYDAHLRAMRDSAPVHVETVSPVLGHWVAIDIHPTAGGGLSVYFRDISERKKASERLRESEEFNRRILESSSDCIKVLDTSARLQFMSPGGLKIMEVEDFGTIGECDWREFWHGPDHDKAQDAVRTALAGGNARFQGHAPTLKGRPRWWDVAVTPITGPGGEVERLLSVSRDITEAKQAEDHQKLLIHELNHRVKNTLATVQSITSQTLRNSLSQAEARTAIEDRLIALSRAHDVLTRENWESANLREIVAQAVEPYSNAREDRLHLSGPDVRLRPRTALALAMALQELATNAVKYGALSNDTGEVRIEWSLHMASTPHRLKLTWTEAGGPPVQTPTRRGFGTRLIERSLAQDLEGHVSIEFAPEGLRCRVDAPLAAEKLGD